MDKTIDKPQGLLPWLNIKGVSQDGKYSQRENKGFGQEKKKSLPEEEKVSLSSLRDGKDKNNKEEPEKNKTGTNKKDKSDKLPANIPAKQIDITI